MDEKKEWAFISSIPFSPKPGKISDVLYGQEYLTNSIKVADRWKPTLCMPHKKTNNTSPVNSLLMTEKDTFHISQKISQIINLNYSWRNNFRFGSHKAKEMKRFWSLYLLLLIIIVKCSNFFYFTNSFVHTFWHDTSSIVTV